MRFLLLKFVAAPTIDSLPDAGTLDAIDHFNRALRDAGVLLGTDRLRPSARRVRLEAASDRQARAVDAPEVVVGYWLIQVRSHEEALAWARRCPLSGDEAVEVRQAIPHDTPD